MKNWLIGKDPDAGKDWRQEDKEMTEDEMAGWHHWLNGHESECLKTYSSLVVDFITIQREKYSISELEMGASYTQILC